MPTVRPTTTADIDVAMRMFDHSRCVMRATGNLTQWVGYPTEADLRADISRGVSYILEHRGKPIATFAMPAGDEPTYARIVRGRWIDPSSTYATLHRLAASEGSHGVAQRVFAYAKSQHSHLRADTHADNAPMRHILEREGFVACGIVFMADGSERIAYEWWRWDEVEPTLQAYVEHYVMPRYDAFDSAHRRDHARRVIARAMMLSRRHAPTDHRMAAMTYTAAAMHDLGLRCGREIHHLASGTIVRQSHALRRHFSPAEVESIAQAVEDHRASAATPPRSALGCWIAEADHDIEPHTILRRAVQYGLDHYPSLPREGHWQRTLQHLDEKYSEHGYLRLLMPDSPNAAALAELRALIANPTALRLQFDSIFDQYAPKP